MDYFHPLCAWCGDVDSPINSLSYIGVSLLTVDSQQMSQYIQALSCLFGRKIWQSAAWIQ